ncbi:serine hydrolase domain-containing protein [Paenibacillus sp. A14]|uniref:serine hydrolase domain-containing protein n=1 Tax=Paenibacillus sp. A14 TaxID=3119820 RepID=UPI002FDF1FAD
MTRNVWPTEAWRTADPASLGLDADRLMGLEPEIAANYGNINGILIVKNGFLTYEKYFNGYGPDDVLHVASVTKTIISVLVGMAVDAGLIPSTERKVLDFFPEYKLERDHPVKKEITLRHLLTMTAPYPFEDWQEPLDKLCMQPDWVEYTLNMLGQKGELGAFKYSTAGAHLLSAILSRATGQSAREFANERLFGPLGMKVIPDYAMEDFGFEELFGAKVKGWVHDPNGNSTGGWGLTLTPRDMARFGLLCLNRGRWDGHALVSEAWMRESTAMTPHHYGYCWWLREEDGVFAYMAMGDGGNIICCIPGQDMVVAIASGFMVNPRDRWTLIKEKILPEM